MHKAAIFDLDGTLIDSAPDIHIAGNKVLAEQGLAPVTLGQMRGFVGHGAAVLVDRLMAHAGLLPDPARHEAMLASLLAQYETTVAATRLYPGVAEALTALQWDGWMLGICTNKTEAATRFVLRHFGLLDTFAVLVCGDSLPQRKPDPAPLHAAIAALDHPATLFVGDSEVDAETAFAAGVDFALFTEGYRKAPLSMLPHHAAFSAFDAFPPIAADWWASHPKVQP